jgi:nucleoid-associated protein YgaU
MSFLAPINEGASLLTDSVRLERAYLVKASAGPLGLLRGVAGEAGETVGNTVGGGGGIGGNLDSADNAVANTPAQGAANAMRQYLTFAFNPTSIRVSRNANWQDGFTVDGVPTESRALPLSKRTIPTPQFTGPSARTLHISELYLDAQESGVPSVQGDAEFLLSLCAPASGPLGDLMEMLGHAPEPPLVRFIWGAMVGFLSYVSSVEVEYQLFRPNGMPTRAKCSITLVEMPESLLPQNPTSGGLSVRQSHTVVEGESLPSVASSRLGDPRRWRDIAEANGIDDPFRVRPGHALMLPVRPEATRKENGKK